MCIRDRRGRELEEMLAVFLAYHCPLGRLFGNRVWAASVRFLDTVLSRGAVERRAGIGIDRARGIVRENVLYFVETTEAGIEVPLTMVGEVWKPGSSSSKLLAYTLEAVRELGITLGGRKSAGLGLLSLQRAEFHVVKLDEDKDGVLLANPFKAPAMSLSEFISWLASK